MSEKGEYNTKYIVGWFVFHILDLAFLVNNVIGFSIIGILIAIVIFLFLLLIYNKNTISLLAQIGRSFHYFCSYLLHRKMHNWTAEERNYCYSFSDRSNIENYKQIVVRSRITNLQCVEDKFMFLGNVREVKHNLRKTNATSKIQEKKDTSTGYHHVILTLDKTLNRQETTTVGYKIKVTDGKNETVPIYGITISQPTKVLEMTVKIPPALNPQNIHYTVYATSASSEPIHKERLAYSQEEHQIRKKIVFPCYGRRYCIEWKWGTSP